MLYGSMARDSQLGETALLTLRTALGTIALLTSKQNPVVGCASLKRICLLSRGGRPTPLPKRFLLTGFVCVNQNFSRAATPYWYTHLYCLESGLRPVALSADLVHSVECATKFHHRPLFLRSGCLQADADHSHCERTRTHAGSCLTGTSFNIARFRKRDFEIDRSSFGVAAYVNARGSARLMSMETAGNSALGYILLLPTAAPRASSFHTKFYFIYQKEWAQVRLTTPSMSTKLPLKFRNRDNNPLYVGLAHQTFSSTAAQI